MPTKKIKTPYSAIWAPRSPAALMAEPPLLHEHGGGSVEVGGSWSLQHLKDDVFRRRAIALEPN